MNCLFYCDWYEEYTANLALAMAGETVSVSMIVREQAPEFTGQGRTADGERIRQELRVRIAHHHVLRGRHWSTGSLRSIFRVIRGRRPDIFHIQQTSDPRFLWFAWRLPTAMTLHEPFVRRGDFRPGGLRQAVSNATQWLYRRLCDLIIVHTQTSFDGLSRTERRKAVIIPHGVPVSTVDFTSDSKTILFFGRAHGYKGLDDLLAAMYLVWESEPEARLQILASPGDYDKSITDARVTASWTGYSNAQLQQALSEARAVALPYTTASGSGVAAQAYGSGKPLVASNLEGLRDLVEREELLVTPGDPEDLARALLRVLNDDYGSQPIDLARTWPGVAKAHIRAYDKLPTRVRQRVRR